jgi:hypothetical protein
MGAAPGGRVGYRGSCAEEVIGLRPSGPQKRVTLLGLQQRLGLVLLVQYGPTGSAKR